MALIDMDFISGNVEPSPFKTGTESFTAGQQKEIDTGLDSIKTFLYESKGKTYSRWHTLVYCGDLTPTRYRTDGGNNSTTSIQTTFPLIGDSAADGWNAQIKAINGGKITIQAATDEAEDATWIAM